MSVPLISVVTPVRNTARYLAQCIESVLAQSYANFEYLLVDNCSTDGSREIIESYARRDARIRVVLRSQLVSQVENYNGALAEICDTSRYCKMVQADDTIFPDCLGLMLRAFDQSESIGLVSSYYQKGNTIMGAGIPYPETMLAGKELARMYLRTGVYVFGSPSTVAYRSSIVRQQQPFYDASVLHEDTEKCMQILQQWDIGFVHQVLSFLRVGNESISSAVRVFQPEALDRYIMVQRYAPVFLDRDEAAAVKRKCRHEYYSTLSSEALKFPPRAFWRYHRVGLGTLGERIDLLRLARQIGGQLVWAAANPGASVARLVRYCRRKIGKKVDSRSR